MVVDAGVEAGPVRLIGGQEHARIPISPARNHGFRNSNCLKVTALP